MPVQSIFLPQLIQSLAAFFVSFLNFKVACIALAMRLFRHFQLSLPPTQTPMFYLLRTIRKAFPFISCLWGLVFLISGILPAQTLVPGIQKPEDLDSVLTVIAISGLRVRETPTLKARILGKLPFNSEVRIADWPDPALIKKHGRDWTAIQWKGKTAYVASRYVFMHAIAQSDEVKWRFIKQDYAEDVEYCPACHWYGVYAIPGGWALRKIRLSFFQEYTGLNGPGVFYDPNTKTPPGFIISAPDPLVTGSLNLTRPPLPRQITYKNLQAYLGWGEGNGFKLCDLVYGLPARFESLVDLRRQRPPVSLDIGKGYTLTGQYQEEQLTHPNPNSTLENRLYNEVVLTAPDGRRQVLSGPDISDTARYGHATVPWVGDLDQDGKPDFILDTGSERSGKFSLFLSSMAEKGEVVGLAGITDYAYGC